MRSRGRSRPALAAGGERHPVGGTRAAAAGIDRDAAAARRAAALVYRGAIATLRVKLVQQLFRGIYYRWPGSQPDCAACEAKASQIAAAFLDQLPELRRLVLLDVQAAFDGDPAATGLDEWRSAIPGSMPSPSIASRMRCGNLARRWCRA